MLATLRTSLFGEEGAAEGFTGLFGLGGKDESPADQFASWLPYVAYLDEEQLFVNRDGIGFLLEIMPQSGADDRMVEVLISLYANCPAATGIQFHLFASPHIRPQLRRYANLRMEDADQLSKAQRWGRPARNDNLFRVLARRRFDHLTAGAQDSLTQGFHYTMRDFRLMMSVTLQGDPSNVARREEIVSLRDGMSTTLRSASLPNRVCDAADLINWCSLFLNPDRITSTHAPDLHYDDGREIRDQIVDHDTIQDARANGLHLWKEGGDAGLDVRFFSIKSFPERFGLWQMGSLIGDLMQPALQYNAPFLLTMGVHVLDPNATRTTVTANHVRATQNAGSKMAVVMPDVGKKARDWTAAADVIDAGGAIVSLYHQLALFTQPDRAVQAQETAKAIWRARGFELNADVYMHRQALIASLPMTMSPRFHGDLRKMRRVTRKTMGNAIHLAPLIAEWRGTRTPTMLFGGRRGQLMTLDVYDNDLGNYNFAIIGAPGSGKSVLMNEMAWSYRSIGARVWMLDLGRSFEKLCKKAGGTYIEFRSDSKINLNPFSVVTDERVAADGTVEGGINEDIDMLKPALAKMCSMGRTLEEVQLKALGAMALKLYKEYGRDLTITGLRDAFKTGSMPELGLNGDQRVKDLAVMLNPYTRDGEYLKTRHTMSLYRGQHRGVVLSTATPVANSMAEIHTFQRYLQPNTLEALGLEQFDAWAATFGETVTALEIAPDGSGYRLNTRFARFINVPDLMGVFCEVADIRTREMLNLPVPVLRGQKPRTVTCRPSSALKAYVQSLVRRAERLRTERIDPRVDNMLSITNDGRKAALDMRLVDATALADPEGKVVKCAYEVHEIWQRTAGSKCAQLVFCDLSTPKGGREFNVYEDLRDHLVAQGLPADEIAFIHDAETDAQKARLFRRVREGSVRVLLGSTQKMGIGTNVQKRLVAVHELDCPWRPCDVEQREGRILRQGNDCEEVEIVRYVAEGSFDAYSWQTVLTKAKFIAQVMSGDKGLRSIEDVELATLSYAEVKALASGNPKVIEKAGVDADIARYSSLFMVWRNQRYANESEVAHLPMRIESSKKLLSALTSDADAAASLLHAGDLAATIHGRSHRGTESLGDALRTVIRMARASVSARSTEELLGEVGSFELWVFIGREFDDVHLYLKGEATHDCRSCQTGPALYQALRDTILAMSDRRLETERKLASTRRRLDELREELGKPFEHKERLTDLLGRQRALAAELDLDKDEAGTQGLEASEESLAA